MEFRIGNVHDTIDSTSCMGAYRTAVDERAWREDGRKEVETDEVQ